MITRAFRGFISQIAVLLSIVIGSLVAADAFDGAGRPVAVRPGGAGAGHE